MINISYIRLLNAFESFANAHLQIKRFAADFPEQMPNFGTENEKYPILFVSPDSSVFDENANQLTTTVYCFDIIEKDRSNINSILSDTNTILNDVYRWFKDGDIFGIDVMESTQATPINNALLDYAAGWSMSITFTIDTYGICEIPFNDSPVIITEVCDIVYSQYLTCETVSECPVIEDLIDNPVKFRITPLISGSCDGSNTDFTFEHPPEMVIYNGQILLEGVGYDLSGETITTTFVPFTDENIWAYANYKPIL